MTVVRNGGWIAFVIAFDITLPENKFGQKKVVRHGSLTALMI